MDIGKFEKQLADLFREALGNMDRSDPEQIMYLNMIVANCTGAFWAATMKTTGYEGMLEMFGKVALTAAEHGNEKLQEAQKNRP